MKPGFASLRSSLLPALRPWLRGIAPLVVLLAGGGMAHAFSLPDRATIDQALDRLGGSDTFDDSKAIDWGFLPGPFYTPLTNAGLGAALVGLYQTDHSGKDTPLSTISMTGFASVTGAFGLNLDNYSYFNADQWRLFVSGQIQNLPTYYSGIGYDAGRANLRSAYTAHALDLHPQLLVRIATATYAGLGWELAQLHAIRLEDGSANPIHDTADGPSVLSSGLSAHLLHDTRDFIPNPKRGQVWSLDLSEYARAFASEDRFTDLVARYGLYHALDDHAIIAFDLHGEFSSGNVPWNQLPSLGNDERMRGYYNGQYRDRNAVSTQIEWRQQLAWRHGVVAWAGAGTLAPSVDQLGQHWLPTVGAGYRFMFKPGINVRLDMGFGRASSGFYFQVGEAF